jgi:hypothetical protein
MEGPNKNTPAPTGPPPRPSAWRDGALLLALLLVAAAIHTWSIAHTEVTARDGVGFIRYAWQLQSQGWVGVLRENPHPPLYPLSILAAAYPVRHWAVGSPSAVMQLSAQVAAALAGTLLVIPIFLLGRELFDRRVGFWAALLFQCLPLGSRVLSDALSEGLFLLLTATALLLAVHAFRSQSLVRFAFSGLCGGLAYLTRPEGMLIVAATLLVLVGVQTVPRWRRPWRPTLACGAGVILAAAAVAAPYVAVIGQLTNKTTGHEVLQVGLSGGAAEPLLPAARDAHSDRGRSPLTASALGIFGPGSKELGFFEHHAWCLASIGREIIRGYHYLAWAPAVVGLVWFRGLFRGNPGPWVVLVLMLLHILVLWRVAYVVGYVAERHSLLIVMASLFWAVAALLAVGDSLGVVVRRITGSTAGTGLLAGGRAWSLVLLLGLAGSALPKTLEPLHANRAGFHAAGLWLAKHAPAQDFIMDPFSWVEYYSGQVYRSIRIPCSPTSGEACYVVLGGTKNEHERLPLMPTAKAWAALGSEVFHWPTQKLRYKAEEVVIYRVPLPLGQESHD